MALVCGLGGLGVLVQWWLSGVRKWSVSEGTTVAAKEVAEKVVKYGVAY